MKHKTKFWWTLGVGAVALLVQFGFHQPQLAYLLIAIIGSWLAFFMLLEMIQTLKSGQFGVDILALTAIIATLAVKEYWASLMILIMLTGGDSLEDYARRKANQELSALLDRSPQQAHRLVRQQVVDVSVEQIAIDDELLIKPHETIPVDGVVVTGTSVVDEATVTGEAQLITKKPGSSLLSGTINGECALTMRAEKTAENSQYQLIVKLVQASKKQPAHFVRMADRYAVPFTLIAYLIAGLAWFLSKDPVRFAEVLVVASPCPLILAAPIALVAGMSRASATGIILKSGNALELLDQARTFAFDKTGTLTTGCLTVASIEPVATLQAKELLQLAASVEAQSTHVLARSLVQAAQAQELALLPVTGLEEIAGQGVQAYLGSDRIKIGKASFVTMTELTTPSAGTVAYLSKNDEYLGQICFADQLRPEAKQTLMSLREQGIEKIDLLTGDHAQAAEKIAQHIGIDQVFADCLPQDKIRILQELPKSERPVVMVGDGVNDAPALAEAEVGIALGANGSSVASETADLVILTDDLSKVSQSVQVAQETMKIARQSVLLGIVICILLMLVASTGIIPALIGALLQEVVDTVSILSSLRARKGTHRKKSE